MKHYKFLERVFAKICHLSDVVRMLYLSSLDVESRVCRVCTLQEIRQEILDSDMVSEAIGAALSNRGQLSDWEVANLHCMNRMYKCLRGVPVDLMHNLVKVRVECKSRWASLCRGEEPIQNVLECFAEVVKLSSEAAAAKAADLGASNKYDVMLSICDGDLTTKKMDEVFTDMGAFFRQFVGEVMEKQGSHEVHAAKVISDDKQRALHEYTAAAMGGGAVVVPCLRQGVGIDGGAFEDAPYVIDESDYRSSLKGFMEGLGKFLYSSNLPQKWRCQPVGGYPGSVMYEAQGLLMSCHLLRDRGFLTFLLPVIKRIFAIRGKVADVDNILLHLGEVKPNMLLEKSDEVTSLAHAMLRYALEKEMINDDLRVQDLPDAWAQGMRYYFDAAPSSEREGCMQDGYWIDGAFGYVPCKVIASIAAAQIFSAMGSSKADVLGQVEKGNLSGVVTWLSKHVYSYGGRYSSTTLLKKITGKRVDVDSYKNYLVCRYLSM